MRGLRDFDDVRARNECPAEDCEGGFEVDVVDGRRGGAILKTTCEHGVAWCAYCGTVTLVNEMVVYSRSDSLETDAPTPTARFCPTCAAAGKVEEVPGWES